MEVVEVVSAVAAAEASSIVAAIDGIAIGAIKRPKSAMIASRRATNEQTCIGAACHNAMRKRR